MTQKTEPPDGGSGGSSSSCAVRATTQGDITPAPRLQQGQLALALHSETAAVVVTESRDHGRLTVTIWTRAPGQRWRPNAAASIPSVMLDATIEALLQARDAKAGSS